MHLFSICQIFYKGGLDKNKQTNKTFPKKILSNQCVKAQMGPKRERREQGTFVKTWAPLLITEQKVNKVIVSFCSAISLSWSAFLYFMWREHDSDKPLFSLDKGWHQFAVKLKVRADSHRECSTYTGGLE